MPFPYKRILCPVDLDGNSAAALKEGAILALSCAAKLCVLHVVQINPLVNQGIFEGADPAGLYETQLSWRGVKWNKCCPPYLRQSNGRS